MGKPKTVDEMRPDFFTEATWLVEGEIPSVENINRWREYILSEHGGTASPTINAIFDCAVLGATQATDIKEESTKMMKDRLRKLVKSL